jgi:hypothetical protein
MLISHPLPLYTKPLHLLVLPLTVITLFSASGAEAAHPLPKRSLGRIKSRKQPPRPPRPPTPPITQLLYLPLPLLTTTLTPLQYQPLQAHLQTPQQLPPSILLAQRINLLSPPAATLSTRNHFNLSRHYSAPLPRSHNYPPYND